MEILQTIWTALTSESELGVKIISIPITFVEIYLYMILFLPILKIDSTKKAKLLFVLVFSSVSIINMFFVPAPYYTFINALSIPVLVFFIFKCGLLKAILAEIVTYVITIILSTLTALLYLSVAQISIAEANSLPIHKLLLSILLHISLYLTYKLFLKYKITISVSKLEKFKFKNVSLIILNFLIGSVAIGFEAYLMFNYIDFMPTTFVFSSLFVLLLYFILSIFSLIRTNNLELTKQNLEEQKMYNKTLSVLHDNIRGFKHDFYNMVQAIGGYLSTENIDGLKTYYKDLLTDCQINNTLSVLNPELINNPALYSLLCNKYYCADELDIKMEIEVMMDLSNLNIKMYELTRILGILFDNAIEAASQCENKIVNITFRKDTKKNIDLIIIKNTYTNKDVNIDRIFEKGFSTKAEIDSAKNHGLGLWEVRKNLKKHKNLNLFTTKDDTFFTQQFEIYN